MKRKSMAMILQGILAALAGICLLFFFVALPRMGRDVAEYAPEYQHMFWPCLLWAWVFGLPVLVSVVPAWQIFGTIREKGKPFCVENAQRFRLISLCALASGTVLLCGLIVLMIAGVGSAPLFFFAGPIGLAVCAVFGFACHVMSRLVQETAEMREENELTV